MKCKSECSVTEVYLLLCSDQQNRLCSDVFHYISRITERITKKIKLKLACTATEKILFVGYNYTRFMTNLGDGGQKLGGGDMLAALMLESKLH